MPLHCTMVNAGRQIGGYPIRQYKPTGWIGISNVNGAGSGRGRWLATCLQIARSALFAFLLHGFEYVSDLLAFGSVKINMR